MPLNEKGKIIIQNTDTEQMKKNQHIENGNLTAFTPTRQKGKLKLQIQANASKIRTDLNLFLKGAKLYHNFNI